MNEKTKTVYYCYFCRKHGLSRHAMRSHEYRCTMNPFRVCGWHDKPHDLPELVAHIREVAPIGKDDIDELVDSVDGCPACTIAVLRQSGVEYHYDARSNRIFEYDDIVKAYREDERWEAQQQEYRDIQNSWI